MFRMSYYNTRRRRLGTENPQTTIRFGCLPFMIALVILITLKASGSVVLPWWQVILIPIGLYWFYVILGTILFLIVYMLSSR